MWNCGRKCWRRWPGVDATCCVEGNERVFYWRTARAWYWATDVFSDLLDGIDSADGEVTVTRCPYCGTELPKELKP